MTFNAFLFGDDWHKTLDPLVQTGDEAPAHIWVPLDVEHASGRSGWHTVRRELSYLRYADKSDVHCAWPTVFLRWYLGPHALLPDSAVSALDVARSRVKRREGVWHARVPRFFQTIGSDWLTPGHWHNGKRSADAGEGSCVRRVDLEASLQAHDPVLIVGPQGPCFYEPRRTEGFESRRWAAIVPLMQLPPRTGVQLVVFREHGEPREYDEEWWATPYNTWGYS